MRKKKVYSVCIFVLTGCMATGQLPNRFSKQTLIDSVPAAGFYQVNLLPDLAAWLQPDMRDIRLIDAAGKQIPYILKADIPFFKESKFTGLPIISSTKEADKQTHIVIENTLQGPLDELLLIIKNTDAGRSVTLTGSDDKKAWFVIKENIYLNNFFTNATDRFIQSLVFPRSNYRYFTVIINGKGVLPLNIIQAGVYEQTTLRGRYLPLPPAILKQKDSTDKYSYITAQLKAPYFADRLIFKITGPKFYSRQAEVYTDADASPALLTSVTISSDRETMIPITAKTKRFLIKINNNDNPPLKIDSVTAFQLNRYMVAYLEKNIRYQLLFADSTAGAPVYDLEVFKDSITGKAMGLSYGVIEEIQLKNSKSIVPKTGNKAIIWLAIGFAIIILLLLSNKLLADIKKKP